MTPLLSVLIATVPHRAEKLAQLLGVLLPQAEKWHFEVIGLRNAGDKPLGEYRAALLDEARGTYACFVDDDDTVPGCYAAAIFKAAVNNPDVIGFEQQCSGYGMAASRCSISLRWVNPPQEAIAGWYLRSVSHVCPVRTELARQAPWTSMLPHTGEDMDWARRMTPLLRDRGSNEAYIDRVMYHYQWTAADSTQFGMRDRYRGHEPGPLPSFPAPFRWHEWSR